MALGKTGQTEKGMVDLAGPLLVRIRRQVYRGGLDDDNMQGGCKQLRDAIAAMLGRAGDSERDGLRFDYQQEKAEKGQNQTVVEIYEADEIERIRHGRED
jgi:hypothetical protein